MLAVGRAVQLMVRLGRLKRAGKRYAYALRSISAGAAPRAGHTQSTPRIETETNRETGAKYCIDAKRNTPPLHFSLLFSNKSTKIAIDCTLPNKSTAYRY